MPSTASIFSGVVFLSLLVAAASVVAAEDESTASEARIQDLPIEKLEVLERGLEEITERHKLGRVEFERVLDAEMALLNAKLDLATSKADRVSLLESQLKNRQTYETLLQERFKSGHASRTEYLNATVARIDAAIALERAKAMP